MLRHGGGGAVLSFFSEGERIKGGQSTTGKGPALPTRRFPPTAWLSNSLLGHGGQCHTQSVSHYRQQNLLIRLQEDRGTKGVVQSLRNHSPALKFWSPQANIIWCKTGSKKSPDFFCRAHYPPHLSGAFLESMGEINNQIWFYRK